jgi:hypothetical protein
MACDCFVWSVHSVLGGRAVSGTAAATASLGTALEDQGRLWMDRLKYVRGTKER